MIKLVTFDATDTLIRLSRPLGEQYLQAARKLNVIVPASSQVIEKNFKMAFKKNAADFPNYGRSAGMTQKQWWNRVVHETFASAGCSDIHRMETVFEYLHDQYAKPHMWELFSETPGLLEILSRRKIAMGIISNFDDRLSDIVQGLKIRHYFSFILTGYEIGAEKPSLDMFVRALQDNDCDAANALHIGDSLEKDYYPAKRLGMNALLVNRGSKRQELDPTVAVIHSLDCIVDFIDHLNYS
jgi:REG-2-like HAD superfamily hydrolase